MRGLGRFLTSVVIFMTSVCKSCHCTNSGEKTLVDHILVIVMTQSHPHHVDNYQKFKAHITQQQNENQTNALVLYTHLLWPRPGAWTILPLLPLIAEKYKAKKWVLFCDEGTRIDLYKLAELLNKYNSDELLYIGRGLRDREATIIHHFAFHEDPGSFVYPDIYTGFVMTGSLAYRISNRLADTKPQSDFSIDAPHEFAMYLRANGHLMTEDIAFCGPSHVQRDCVTTYPHHSPKCESSLGRNEVFFAVKTCEKFHKDRVPVVQNTWGKEVPHLVFYSDVEDAGVPTVATGLPNTERGHCGKMMVILEQFYLEAAEEHYKWLVIADDDTLLSVERLVGMLSCYGRDEPAALGERYGYGLLAGHGYDYLTGGAGIVLNHLTVRLLLESGVCRCAANDSPDDMTLGLCLKRLAIPVTHSPLFHQARPVDYAEKLLEHQTPISFHKHWMIDPFIVFHSWLKQNSQKDEL